MAGAKRGREVVDREYLNRCGFDEGSPMWGFKCTEWKEEISKLICEKVELRLCEDLHALVFLFMKGVLPENGIQRTKFLDEIFSRGDSGEKNAALDRLLTLLKPDGDWCSEELPADVQSWEQAMTELPEWKLPDSSYVWHRDTLAKTTEVGPEVVPYRRVQKLSVCFIHAPVVLLANLQHKTEKKKVEMVDITKWVREYFRSQALYDLFFVHKGGSSRDILKALLELDSRPFVKGLDDITPDLLDKYGPGLISYFQVYDDLKEKGRLRYDGVPAGSQGPRHSMLLIGVRDAIQSGSSKRFFLVQNWSKDKQFIEMSEEYMDRCDATVVFVRRPQHFRAMPLPTVDGVYAETELAGLAETCALEGMRNRGRGDGVGAARIPRL